MKVCCWTLVDVPLVGLGFDLAEIISERVELAEGDIVAVSSCIVSKAEEGPVPLDSFTPTEYALSLAARNGADPRFVQAVLDNSKEVLLESPFLLVERENGHICVNAGIDTSNVGEDDSVLLLPKDADKSARALQLRLESLSGVTIGVVIIDTNGRAFREGQTGVAIGVAGVEVMRDWRGGHDLFDNILEVAHEAALDELAGFANLLMGEGDGGTPVVVLRGLRMLVREAAIAEVFRRAEDDVIRKALKGEGDNSF
ncbi:coenzyme F420-0:L-glutamate ligase [Methanosarcinales archaeon]|nr:MAG: coenzyme F420-0:L-glutamate ligase [Methanosarcinales archaeon]